MALLALIAGCGGSAAGRTVSYTVLEDPDGTLTIEQVASDPLRASFSAPREKVANLGLTSSTWWLRLDLAPSPDTQLLELAWPLVDEATLFRRTPSGGYSSQRAGRRVPVGDWPLHYRRPTFPLDPADDAETFLRVSSRESLVLPLHVWSESGFDRARSGRIALGGFYFGMLFVMAASGLLVFLVLGDVGFLSYAALVGTFGLWQASFEGLLSTYVWPDAWWWTARALHVFGVLCVASGWVFARIFLATPTHAPRLDLLPRVGLPAFGILLLWALVWPGPLFVWAATSAAMLVGVWVVVAATVVARRGYRFARYFLLSWAFAVVAALVQALRDLGFLPSNLFTGYGMQFGIALTFVTLSLALIDRILAMREDLDRRADDVRRLEREDEAKRTFLAVASHDLRQPLHAVGLLLGALRDRLQDDRSLSLVDKIQSATGEMGEMFGSLLDLSRLDAGMVEPTIEDVDVRSLFSRLEDEFGVVAEHRGVRLRVIPGVEVVRSDPTLLNRILRNLLSNACRYTQQGEIVLAAEKRQDRVELSVADTGPGIPEAQQKEIFDAYRRLPDSRAAAPAGMGLGLSIVRRLADLLGHEVRVESSVGHGARFVVEVPPGARVAPAATADRPTPSRVGDLVVLVVEDDDGARDGMREQLGSWGCTARMAGSRAEALEQAALEPSPDVVLADYHVGTGVTGVDIVTEVRALLGRAVPAVVVTGDSSDAPRVSADGAGCSLLIKPVAPARLRTILNRVARQKNAPPA